MTTSYLHHPAPYFPSWGLWGVSSCHLIKLVRRRFFLGIMRESYYLLDQTFLGKSFMRETLTGLDSTHGFSLVEQPNKLLAVLHSATLSAGKNDSNFKYGFSFFYWLTIPYFSFNPKTTLLGKFYRKHNLVTLLILKTHLCIVLDNTVKIIFESSFNFQLLLAFHGAQNARSCRLTF